MDIVRRLQEYGIEPIVFDPWADKDEALREYGVKLVEMNDVKDVDCVVVAVAHREFRDMGIDNLKSLYAENVDDSKVLIDVKGIYRINELNISNMKYWRL